MNKYFQKSIPIDRNQFLTVYRESVQLAHLLTAPFGIPDDLSLIINENCLVDEYTLLYKQWEETISRRIYALQGISDDQIASALHTYVNVNSDQEIIAEIQHSSQAVSDLFHPAKVVEFPVFSDINLVSPEITAILIVNVLTAIYHAFQGLSSDTLNTFVDIDVKKACSIIIFNKPHSPLDLNSESFGDKCLGYDSMMMLKKALRVSILSESFQELNGNLEGDIGTINDTRICTGYFAVSIEQYYMLVKLFGDSEVVQLAVTKFLQSVDITPQTSLNVYALGLDCILLPTVNPVFSLLFHLRLRSLSDSTDSSIDSVCAQLDLLSQSLESRVNANGQRISGNVDTAVSILTSVLERTKNENHNKEEGSLIEDGEDCHLVLPVHLRVQLLLDRIQCLVQQELPRESLNDCNAVLTIDPRCALAYQYRSQLLVESNESMAAEDALAAFILGGANDVSLASVAEEVIRKSCRREAKLMFKLRITQLTEKPKDEVSILDSDSDGIQLSGSDSWGSQLPKIWLVKSFFSGYELLSDAFAIIPLPISDNDGHTNTLIDFKDQDIDESCFRVEGECFETPPPHLLNHEPISGTAVLSDDCYAYYVLRLLCEMIDSLVDKEFFIDSPADNLPVNVVENSGKTHDIVDIIINPEDIASNQLLSLIDIGVADSHANSNGTVLNEVLSSNESNCANDSVDSNVFLKVLQILREPRISRITGVILRDISAHLSSGLIVSVRPARVSSSSIDEEEEVWEDCNVDEDEDDNDDDSTEIQSFLPLVTDSEDGGLSTVSGQLRARLLNICSSVAYLCGDSPGAVECLRVAMREDPALLDSALKLGALLIDMDCKKEAKSLLKSVQSEDPRNTFGLIHLAELHIHDSNFALARSILQEANSNLSRSLSDPEKHFSGTRSCKLASDILAEYLLRCRNSSSTLMFRSKQQIQLERLQCRRKLCVYRLHANVSCLRAVVAFRKDPTQPEIALDILHEAIRIQSALASGTDGRKQNESQARLYLTLCLGEITSQAGDIVAALDLFAQAATLDPLNPLPYTNAARAYQQLTQHEAAEMHLLQAIGLDPSLAMTRVDFAQLLSLQGKTVPALKVLDEALKTARHASEIRDVLTARTVTVLQQQLQDRGICLKPKDRFYC